MIRILNRFLVFSLPQGQKQFYFNWNTSWRVEWSIYLESLKSAAQKITDHFGISHINVSKTEFWEFIKSAKNADWIEFSWCNILSDSECNFGDMKESKIQKIIFVWTGHSSYSNWIANPSRFENIIKGISSSQNFANNLKQISIRNWGLKKDWVDKILNKYSLSYIKTLVT